MKTLARWGKFNLVGVVGAGAQLRLLAVFNHISPEYYLLDTTIALELTLLHNFVWHVRFTWRDRRERLQLLAQCRRFHLSNGIVPLVGNLALMKLLVESAGLPILAANAIAISCCSLLNFFLAETWAFGAGHPQPKAG